MKLSSQMSNVHHVSVNSKPDHPFPGQPSLWKLLKGRIPQAPGTKKVPSPTPVAEKSCLNPTPGAIIFKNPARKHKHEIEIMKHSTEIFRNI